MRKLNEIFRKFAQTVSVAVGSSWAFLIAFGIVLSWAVTGPLFGFSETWQLIINTGTTIVTFLMVFLVQNAQNRDAKATHLKLDELIRAQKSAHNKIIGAEEYSDELMEREKKEEEKSKQGKRRKKAVSRKKKR